MTPPTYKVARWSAVVLCVAFSAGCVLVTFELTHDVIRRFIAAHFSV